MGIGFDCGTYNLVTCKRNDDSDFVYKREINAFLEMPLENEFVFNMMKKPANGGKCRESISPWDFPSSARRLITELHSAKQARAGPTRNP